ncbi:MAG TPA: TIGR01212 family radical SAM protein [Patescibacteria group bacterium]|nr:TIGR01212 family radical SAM protein [Patescibacteria group bacterium]
MRYRMYSEYLKQRYGEKVYKLPVALPVTCPNRDGSLGTGGCAFCGEIGAGYENLPASMGVQEQIEANKAHIAPKYNVRKFIPYFQNFSNTYLPPEELDRYLREACQPEVVGIALATRPDCINEACLDVLEQVRSDCNVDITLELGLQTVNYHTLRTIQRGHSLGEFLDAVLRIQKRRIDICTHLILNLPGDDMTDVIENAKVMSALGMQQVKLHALYIVKNTPMAEWYQNGEISMISREEYVERVVGFLEYLHPDIVIQRLIGRAPETNTLFTNWQTGWWKIREMIERALEERDSYQGKQCSYLNGKALRRFI